MGSATTSNEITSKDLQSVLSPKLKTFIAIKVTEEYHIWISTDTLHDLSTHRDSAELRHSRAIQRQVYAQLAAQKKMQKMAFDWKVSRAVAQSLHLWDSWEELEALQ
ncbi:hypothetical protein BGZ82_001190 [Podila clonocystis]|nr:hypothetical protein BGZ82_001190 [Podila clonocystis]